MQPLGKHRILPSLHVSCASETQSSDQADFIDNESHTLRTVRSEVAAGQVVQGELRAYLHRARSGAMQRILDAILCETIREGGRGIQWEEGEGNALLIQKHLFLLHHEGLALMSGVDTFLTLPQQVDASFANLKLLLLRVIRWCNSVVAFTCSSQHVLGASEVLQRLCSLLSLSCGHTLTLLRYNSFRPHATVEERMCHHANPHHLRCECYDSSQCRNITSSIALQSESTYHDRQQAVVYNALRTAINNFFAESGSLFLKASSEHTDECGSVSWKFSVVTGAGREYPLPEVPRLTYRTSGSEGSSASNRHCFVVDIGEWERIPFELPLMSHAEGNSSACDNNHSNSGGRCHFAEHVSRWFAETLRGATQESQPSSAANERHTHSKL